MPPAQEQLLHHCRGFAKAHPHRELVVEVLLPTAHPAQIEGCVATDLISTDTGICAHDQWNAWDDVEADEALADPSAAGPHLVQLLWCKLGGVEDGQPPISQLAGKLEVLRPNCREIDRNVLADRGNGQLEWLARAIR